MNSLDAILGAKFFQKKPSQIVEVTPEEVFSLGYSSLNELVAFNLKLALVQDRTMRTGYADTRDEDKRTVQRLSENIAYRDDVVAVLETNCGERTYDVKFRTNFHPSNPKKPNICYLVNDEGKYFVLRESRFQQIDFLKVMIRSQGLDSNKINMADFIMNRFDPRFPITIVPEPVLMSILERLYENGYPRITPKNKILDHHIGPGGSGSSWHIRPFLNNPMSDLPFDPVLAGEYIGKLHAYGLMQAGDRKPEHYFSVSYQPNSPMLVDIDPDLCLWTNRDVVHTTLDLPDFTSTVRKSQQFVNSRDILKMRELRNQVLGKLRDDLRSAFIKEAAAVYEQFRECCPYFNPAYINE